MAKEKHECCRNETRSTVNAMLFLFLLIGLLLILMTAFIQLRRLYCMNSKQ